MPTHPPRLTQETIGSVADLDLALGELSHLQALEDAATASHQQAVNLLTEAHKKAMILRGVPIADRRETLTQLITDYMALHQAEVITTGKSRDLTYGTVGYRLSTPKVVPVEGRTEKSVLDKVKQGVLPRCVTYLKGLGLGFGRGINDMVFRLSIAINKDGIVSALKAQHITHEQLAKHGLTVTEPTDELYILPRKTALESHPKAA